MRVPLPLLPSGVPAPGAPLTPSPLAPNLKGGLPLPGAVPRATAAGRHAGGEGGFARLLSRGAAREDEPHRRSRSLDEEPSRQPVATPPDLVDPMARQTAHLAPPVASTPQQSPPAAAAEQRGRASLEDLLPTLVRKVAWSGDGRRGTIRLELGAGALSGATLLVESDAGRVQVHLSAPPGVDLEAWRARIARRLAARGLDVGPIDVD